MTRCQAVQLDDRYLTSRVMCAQATVDYAMDTKWHASITSLTAVTVRSSSWAATSGLPKTTCIFGSPHVYAVNVICCRQRYTNIEHCIRRIRLEGLLQIFLQCDCPANSGCHTAAKHLRQTCSLLKGPECTCWSTADRKARYCHSDNQ